MWTHKHQEKIFNGFNVKLNLIKMFVYDSYMDHVYKPEYIYPLAIDFLCKLICKRFDAFSSRKILCDLKSSWMKMAVI